MASLGEFECIDQLIKAHAAEGQSLFKNPQALGIGDDCALLAMLPAGQQLAVSTDMLIETRHYFSDVDPKALGHKVLAVNLSDLAAMGATPLAFTLAAGLKSINVQWLTAFMQGLLDTARLHQCALIGGDTTRTPDGAPDVFSVTILGSVPCNAALRRDGLTNGDDLWVSGRLGDCAYAVRHRHACEKLLWPQPRVALGQRLRGIASAAIDISDGLLSETLHLLRASNAKAGGTALKANLFWHALPLGPLLSGLVQSQQMTDDEARIFAATGGDEYELLFSAPANRADEIAGIGNELGLVLTRIGRVQPSSAHETRPASDVTVDWLDQRGASMGKALQAQLLHAGFDHFRP